MICLHDSSRPSESLFIMLLKENNYFCTFLYMVCYLSKSVTNLQDVRKIIVLSLPPSSETLSMIIDCTLDVNESARKAAYCVLASKFPLQSLR